MTEQRSPISKELREGFREAIEKYGDWRYGEPEPEVSWNLQPTAISWICEFVSIYDDSMPADLWLRRSVALLVTWSKTRLKAKNKDPRRSLGGALVSLSFL